MLNERRAKVSQDKTSGISRLDVEDAGPAAGDALDTPVTLLLDAHGELVGVDLGGEGLERMVVMVGAHENVAVTREATVGLVRDADGGPREIRIAKEG
jgi:hypothetical protein